jgi:hypothetical protein
VIRVIQREKTAKTVIIHLWKQFHGISSLPEEDYFNKSGAAASEKATRFKDSQVKLSEKNHDTQHEI